MFSFKYPLLRGGTGTSVREAYSADGRDIGSMGASIKGVIHGKNCLVVEGRHSLCLVGSCNWTTSSKSNLEFGVEIEIDTESQFVKNYLDHFEGAWQRASSLDSLNIDPENIRSRRNKDRGGQVDVASASD